MEKPEVQHLLDVANETARGVSARFVTFLSVAAYVGVTVASTTDEMLVRGTLVKLPLLNVEIPISGFFGFFSLAPWLIVLLHVDLLLQLSKLSARIGRFQSAIGALTDGTERRQWSERLADFYFVGHLAGTGETRESRMLSSALTWITGCALPILLLLVLQVRFLSYHSLFATWAHRGAILADAILLLVLWPAPSGATPAAARSPLRRVLSVSNLVSLLCIGAVVFSLAVATIPSSAVGTGRWFALRNLNLSGRVLTAETLRPELIRALRDGPVDRREEALDKVGSQTFLQGRDLRYAKVTNAVLPRADLRALRVDDGVPEPTELNAADLSWSLMQRAMLDESDLAAADLNGAQLQGASMKSTRLPGARLQWAELQDSDLTNADLTEADLKEANLRGANLNGAHLRDATLYKAQLEGARLTGAELTNADLREANLRGVDFSGADLSMADLHGAQLSGALFCSTKTEGAKFDKTPDLSKCRRIPPVDDDLVRLACANSYVARGLLRQSVDDPNAGQNELPRRIWKYDGQPECPGLSLLPPAVSEPVRRRFGDVGRKAGG